MTPPRIEDRPHARVSPSGYERIRNCTKSLVLTAQAPPPTTGIDAAVGTAAHAVFEKCLREDLDTFEVRRGEVVVDGHVVPIDEAMLEGVQIALDWCRDHLEPPLIVEKRVELKFASERLGEPVWGYVDAATMEPVPTVVDLKMGYNPVAADAPQLKLYLLGLLYEAGVPLNAGRDDVVGRTVVIQPNTRGDPVGIAEHVGVDLLGFRDEVLTVMDRIRRRDFTYEAGPWCRWCAGASICPHLAATARDAALTQVTPSPEMVASGEVSADALNEALNLVATVDAWSRAVKAVGEDYLVHGGKLRDWKLVEKRTVRRWVDEETAEAELRKLGIDPHKHTMVSPAEAERRLPPAKRPVVGDLSEKPPGALTLAPASDKRSGVEVAATLQRALEGSVAAGFLARAGNGTMEPHPRRADGETREE